MRGKAIEIFLVNGTPNGIVTAELSNWNGKAIKVPRTEVEKCGRDDIKGAGVYFLFCKEEDGEDSVYVGESENILERLKTHIRDYKSGKENYYWNTVVAFVGTDLNKALIRYLEDRLVNIVRECNRFNVLTHNTYSKTVLKESQIAMMEEFLDNIEILIATLGYNVLTPIPQATKRTKLLYCKGSGADAKGFISANGITVLKDSKVSDKVSTSFKTGCKHYYELRKKLVDDGIIVGNIFQYNFEFSAPSAASAVILGRSSSGNVDWKDENMTKLKDM